MKNSKIKFILGATALMIAAVSCNDQDFKDGKIQSVDNQGHDQNMISTAVTATSNSEFIAYSVDATTDESEIQLIPVVLTAAGTASEDIHVKFVPIVDSLDSYNEANDTQYIMPGDGVGPNFTLENDGVAIIPKGKSVGYLKIKTVTNDFFGDDQYAFAYKIESIQESGYSISGNHNFGIAAVIPKNDFDGVYSLDSGKVERYTGGTLNTGDDLMGPYKNLDDRNLVTTGKYTLAFVPLWANGGGVGGIDNTYIQIDPTPDANGHFPVTMHSKNNATLMNLPGQDNYYDPATKVFVLAFHWGTANERKYWAHLTYKGPR